MIKGAYIAPFGYCVTYVNYSDEYYMNDKAPLRGFFLLRVHHCIIIMYLIGSPFVVIDIAFPDRLT